MVNSFVKEQGGTYVSAVHEASAVMMAYGYACRGARLRRRDGNARARPDEYRDRAHRGARSGKPLLVITGDTAPGNKLNQQTLGHGAFVRGDGGRLRPRGTAGGRRRRRQDAARQALAESPPVRAELPDGIPVASR